MIEFENKVSHWINKDYDNKLGIRLLKARIDYLSEVLFKDYRPTMAGHHGSFRSRLVNWINSAPTDAHQLIMFRMLEHLFFIGSKDLDSLYLTAYSRHVISWLIEIYNISIVGLDAEDLIKQRVSETLFTAITDSFNLGDFLRVNNIHGVSFRFSWEQALKFNWDANVFANHVMQSKSNIILFEDFVGSGSQMTKAVIEACSLPNQPNVLLCPLIICPDGADLARNLCVAYPNLTFKPILELQESSFVKEIPQANEPKFFAEIRSLVNALHPQVTGTNKWTQNYGPFGYEKTGALVVTANNCPDNTLPILHHKSDAPWHPLFHRVTRDGI